MMHKRRLNRFSAMDWFSFLVLTLWGVCILYPFYNALLISLVPQTVYARSPFMLFPREMTLDSYRHILQGNRVFVGYRSTLIIMLLGLPYNMVLTTLTAYGLSKKRFPGKAFFVLFFYFTMFFSGGLVPLYLTMKSLRLTNTLWSVILLMGCDTFYMILMRTYFETLPESLIESARLDGCGELRILVQVVLPLSAPIMATILLFYAVARWNEWFYAMLFIKDGDKTPLQVVLRNIVFQENAPQAVSANVARNTFNDGIKMAAIVLTMAPVMLFYPFVQKHFVKGMLIGAVKS